MNKSQLIEAILALDPSAQGSKLKKLRKAELELALEALQQAEPEVEQQAEPEVEPELTDAEKAHQRFIKASRSMKGTMAVKDRRLVKLSAEGEALSEWKNSNRAYIAGELTASQGDRVTKVLMDALKAGGVEAVEVVGYRWVLAQHFEEGLFGAIEEDAEAA